MIKMTERELREKLKLSPLDWMEVNADCGGDLDAKAAAIEGFKRRRLARYQERIRKGEIQIVRENGTDILPIDLEWDRWEASWDNVDAQAREKRYRGPDLSLEGIHVDVMKVLERVRKRREGEKR